MSRIVPNQNSWVGFSTVVPVDITKPTIANITAATDLTCFVVSINASAQGNTVPTPSICSLFETSIPGTSAATFTGDFYRDDTTDTAWNSLPRNQKGVFYIARFGVEGVKPLQNDKIEVWPVIITSRAASALTSNTAQTFTVTCAVNQVPAEDVPVLP